MLLLDWKKLWCTEQEQEQEHEHEKEKQRETKKVERVTGRGWGVRGVERNLRSQSLSWLLAACRRIRARSLPLSLFLKSSREKQSLKDPFACMESRKQGGPTQS